MAQAGISLPVSPLYPGSPSFLRCNHELSRMSTTLKLEQKTQLCFWRDFHGGAKTRARLSLQEQKPRRRGEDPTAWGIAHTYLQAVYKVTLTRSTYLFH